MMLIIKHFLRSALATFLILEFQPSLNDSNPYHLEMTLSQAPPTTIIKSPRLTNEGNWGPWEFCPTGSFAVGYNLKIQDYQKLGDDTALNAVRLFCSTLNANISNPISFINSTEGVHGTWGTEKFCNGLVNGFQLRSDKLHAPCIDNVGAVDMNLSCESTNSSSKEVFGNGTLDWGIWTDMQKCPKGYAVCGIRTQVYKPHWGSEFLFHLCLADDSGLNNVDMTCCKIPDPAETCGAVTFNWIDIAVCPVRHPYCIGIFDVGFSFVRNPTPEVQKVIDLYKQMGSTLEKSLEIFKTSFIHQKHSIIEDIDYSSLLQDITTKTTKVSQRVRPCAGKLQQLVLTCGFYEIRTERTRRSCEVSYNY